MFDCALFYFALPNLGRHFRHLLLHVVNGFSTACDNTMALMYYYLIHYVSKPLIWLGQPFALYF
jgi:hypothetical protein